MSHDEINELREGLNTLNGKVDLIAESQKKHLEDQDTRDKKMDTFIEEIRPILEAKTTLVSINKFLKWVGLPAVGSIAAYYLFKKI